MIYYSNSLLPEKETGKKYLFLAGSMAIESATNWRVKVSHSLKSSYEILDPTSKKYDTLNEGQMKHHIEWEIDAMIMADVILLNFLQNALSPISLVELGLNVATDKLLVICPKDFFKRNYVSTLCKKYDTPIFNTLEQALQSLK